MSKSSVSQSASRSASDSRRAVPTRRIGSLRTSGRIVGTLGTSLKQHDHTANSTKKLSTWSKGPMSWIDALAPGLLDFPVWYDESIYTLWEPNGPGTTRYHRGANGGMGGTTLSEVWARRDFFINTVHVDLLIIGDIGTNDILSQTKEYVHNYRWQIIDYYLDRGIPVLVETIPMRDTSSWTEAAGGREKCNWVNAQTPIAVQQRRAAGKPVAFIDPNLVWQDPDSAVGNPKAGYCPDGTHRSSIAAYYLAKDSYIPVLSSILPAAPAKFQQLADDVYNASTNVNGNQMLNPMQAGTTGTISAPVTGQCPTNMRMTRSGTTYGACVSSVEDRPGRDDKWEVLTITPAVGSTASTDTWYYQTEVSNIAHAMAPGTWVRAGIEVNLSNWDAWKGVSMYLKDNATSGQLGIGMEDYDDAWPTSYDGPFFIWSPPILISEAGALTWRVIVKTKSYMPVPTPGVVKLGQPQLRIARNPKTLVGYTSG